MSFGFLPSRWRTIPLLAAGDWLSGGTPSRKRADYWQGDIPWLGSKDVTARYIEDSSEHVSAEGAATSSRVLPASAIVMVVRGMSLAKEFRVGVTTRPMAFNQDVKGLIPSPELEPRFMGHYLNYIGPRVLLLVETASHGTKRLPTPRLHAIPTPCPPLSEQRRIADILDKADAIRRKRQDAIVITQELLRSAFLDMFGDPVTNPREWPVVVFADCIEAVEAGWSAQGEERSISEGEWGVLKISAVTSGRFKPEQHKVVTNATFAKPPIIPRRGDLLFSRANTRELVAATCLVEETQKRLFLPDKLWRIRCDSTVATAEYMRFLLASPHFRMRLARLATGTSGSMLNVSQAKLLAMQAPIPPLSAQKKFGAVVWATYRLRRRQEIARVQSDDLFNSLAQRAFRGELNSKDEESA